MQKASMTFRSIRAVSDYKRKATAGTKMVFKVNRTTWVATLSGNQSRTMRGLLMDLALISNDNKFKQTETAFYQQNIFTYIDFKCLKVCTRVLFLALLLGCMLFAECKTKTVNDKMRHGFDSMMNYTISFDGSNSSTVHFGLQSSGLNAPQKPESQLSRVDMARHGSNSTSHNPISNSGNHVSTLNGANSIGVTLANGEPQSFGLNSPQKRESQSSRLDIVRHGLNHSSQNTINNDDANPTTFNDSGLASFTFVKLDQQTSGLEVSQKQKNQSADFDTPQNLETRMRSFSSRNQAGTDSNDPYVALRRGSRQTYGFRPPEQYQERPQKVNDGMIQ